MSTLATVDQEADIVMFLVVGSFLPVFAPEFPRDLAVGCLCRSDCLKVPTCPNHGSPVVFFLLFRR